jgi:hypothetical protein
MGKHDTTERLVLGNKTDYGTRFPWIERLKVVNT